VLQSYGIEPMNIIIFRTAYQIGAGRVEASESNLIAILADPVRCTKLEDIAIRNFSTENIGFCKVYLNHGILV